MPRKAKDEEIIIENKVETQKTSSKKSLKTAPAAKKTTTKKSTAKTKTAASKTAKKTTTKKAAAKSKVEKKAESKEPKSSKKNTVKTKAEPKVETKTAKKTTTAKAKTTKKATSTTKKSIAKKAEKSTVAKKTPSKKNSTVKKSTTTKSTKKVEILEYYDLPYRYNQTVVKVLAQTPKTLFVYWDISDDDKQKYINQYGEYFFNNTKPVLVIHNETTNYTYEVDINDFANSWYLHVSDSDNVYKIELGRRPINKYVQINDNFLHIASSNNIETPNDHILFEHLSQNINFRNVKTNTTYQKNISSLSLIAKLANIKEFYKKLYPNEAINFDKLNLRNPSSATSTFK